MSELKSVPITYFWGGGDRVRGLVCRLFGHKPDGPGCNRHGFGAYCVRCNAMRRYRYDAPAGRTKAIR